MNTDGEVASTCNCLLAGVVFPFIFIVGVLKKLFLLLYFFLGFVGGMTCTFLQIFLLKKELLNFLPQ